ncbi:hypothetical protein C8Q74DRAFT_763230 [Fomes fomentarius]|nr:hypothetical protein C8Q74DRAFT_763230 [Fomes fomentarius]
MVWQYNPSTWAFLSGVTVAGARPICPQPRERPQVFVASYCARIRRSNLRAICSKGEVREPAFAACPCVRSK